MVSQKRRRRQLAHAAAERQAQRRVERDAKRLKRQRIIGIIVAVLLVAGLAAWIATHPGSNRAESGSAGYSGLSATASIHGVPR